MSLFDYFEPKEQHYCMRCQTVLTDWQSKDGPCALFVWREGTAAPVDQRAGESNIPPNDRAVFRLPDAFEIYSYSCKDCGCIRAKCESVSGIWSKTTLITSLNATQKSHETKAQFKARKKKIRKHTTD